MKALVLRYPRAAGVLYMSVHALLFSLLSLCVKLASEEHSPLDIVFYRNVVSMAVIFAILAATKKLGALKQVNAWRQITRGTLGTVAMIFTFSAFAALPLSEAQSLIFAAPLFAVVLSWPLLKEKVGPYRSLATLIGFGGVLIIVQPGTISSGIGALLGLGSALGIGAVAICLRWLGRTENPMATVFYFSLVSTVWILPAMPFVMKMPSAHSLIFLVASGVLAVGVQYFMTIAYTLAPAALLSPVTYTNLLWATLLDYLVYGHVPKPAIYLGAAIIIASNLFILFRETRLKQKGEAAV